MDENKPLTILDTLVSPTNLLVMKALIPFMSASIQKQLAIFIKTQELMNTIELFNENGLASNSSTSEQNMFDIINTIKVYFPKDTANTIDMMTNAFSMMSAFKDMNGETNMADMFGGMFGNGDFPFDFDTQESDNNTDENEVDNNTNEENTSKDNTDDIISKLTELMNNSQNNNDDNLTAPPDNSYISKEDQT